jgi:hypothetical protein
VREKGGVPAADSTALNPKSIARPENATIRDGISATFNPFHGQPIRASKPSAATPKLPQVGQSYTITFTDPATGEKVTRRLLRKK